MQPAVDDLPPVVTVAKWKLNGARACWRAYELDEDSDGRWLFTPAGSIFRSSDGHRDTACEVEGGGGPGLDSMILAPPSSQDWLATWSDPRRALHISVEVCRWMRQDSQVVCFLDWELDPFRLRSGLVAVEDLDDFADARARGLLDSAESELALASAAWAERTLRARAEPFDSRGDRRLEQAGELGLPALVDAPHPFDV